jgi:glucose-1-phosphate cytidylyltransferase
MKVLILAWWLWTRLSEETTIKPKPMVEIWWKPILWHIMKIYSYYGYNEFVIALWYKWYYIKEWFANYFLHNSDITIDVRNNKIEIHNNNCENWKVTLVDTWNKTMTWWRIKKIIEAWYIEEEEFMMTYGDWVSDVDIDKLVDFHKTNWKLATLTAIHPEWRFWKLWLSWNLVSEFAEKKDNEESYINWWFMILNKKIAEYISSYDMPFEKDPLENIARNWQLMAYKHQWFWMAMDTLKNKQDLENLWNKQNAKWKKW